MYTLQFHCDKNLDSLGSLLLFGTWSEGEMKRTALESKESSPKFDPLDFLDSDFQIGTFFQSESWFDGFFWSHKKLYLLIIVITQFCNLIIFTRLEKLLLVASRRVAVDFNQVWILFKTNTWPVTLTYLFQFQLTFCTWIALSELFVMFLYTYATTWVHS